MRQLFGAGGCTRFVGNKGARRPVSRVLSGARSRARYGVATITHARSAPWMAIHLGRPLPDASRDLPEDRCGKAPAQLAPNASSYLVLLPVGFAVPLPLPVARCALTAPFHPCRPRTGGGLLSVALSLGLTPAGRYPAPFFRGARTFLPHSIAGTRAAIRPSGWAEEVGLSCRPVKPW